jgi:hypothetical protein
MNQVKELGAKLVQDSRLNSELCTQRGVIFHLFPFIFEASKRMSARAIVRWLDAYGTKVSLATVAKALRTPQVYWQEIYEDIEPAARVVAAAHQLEVRALLRNHELFFNLVHEQNTFPNLEGRLPHESPQELYDEYLDACAKLQEDWFCLPAASIEACLSNVADEDNAGTESTGEPQNPAVLPDENSAPEPAILPELIASRHDSTEAI